MKPSRQPDQDPLDAISAAYDRLILSYLRRFDPIIADGDWHLRLAWILDGQPEPPVARVKISVRATHTRGQPESTTIRGAWVD